jgi:hypothetical protein
MQNKVVREQDDYDQKFASVETQNLKDDHLYTNAKVLDKEMLTITSETKWCLERKGKWIKVLWDGQPWECYFEGELSFYIQ